MYSIKMRRINMFSINITSKIGKNNPRRVFRNRMAGYVSSNNKYRGRMPLLCVLAALLSVALLSACMDNANNNSNGGSNDPPALSTAVTNITITAITPTALTLNWTNPADSDGFTGVLISADPAAGTLGMSQQQAASVTTIEITDLNPITTYSFTLTSMYANDSKNSTSPVQPAMTATSANLPIDADGDELIDITSLERLNNIRYNLDLGDGRYKTSADIAENSGMLCGTEQDTNCRGYELIISLDFANPNHYESGELNAAWRPQNSNGTIIAQAQADTATNSGWTPIGTAGSATRFNSRVEGNGHTIRNLYGRRSTAGQLGLFGTTGTSSVIRSIGVATVRLYGSDDRDTIGALVGVNGGIIVASYASGTVNGGAGTDTIGGLVGQNSSHTTVASYASGAVNGGADDDDVGGLVGQNLNLIIASYASSTVNGGADDDDVGGLVGHGSGASAMATYASGTANGDANDDNVGGLMGGSSASFDAANYTTVTVDGGEGTDRFGSLGNFIGVILSSYGFGTATGETPGSDGIARTGGVAAVDTGIVGARTLTIANAGVEWNQVDTTTYALPVTTMNAWDFGTAAQAPALRYADYDGPNDTYGCGDGSNATIVIPSVVATPTGPMTITCGTTLLPEQVR